MSQSDPEINAPESRDPEEYEASGEASVSTDTGTVYESPDADAEPAQTPHDESERADDAETAE